MRLVRGPILAPKAPSTQIRWDLLGVSVDLKTLPLDTSTSGFDNRPRRYVSSYLMETSWNRDRVLDAAIVNGPPPGSSISGSTSRKSVKPRAASIAMDDGVAIFSSWVSANIQVTLWNFRTRFRGKYQFRIGHGFKRTSRSIFT